VWSLNRYLKWFWHVSVCVGPIVVGVNPAGNFETDSMILGFYRLNEQPFGVAPDPRFLYMSPTHREALASAVYGVTAGRGFTALIAKPGMGKTTLLFDLLNRVGKQVKSAFLFQMLCSPHDFLRSLLEDLKIEEYGGDLVDMQQKLNECLLRESSNGKQLVVVIDESQNLNESVLEMVRMLSNFETPREKLIHFILAGQPQLAEKLTSPSLTQLRQRISIIARLEPFTADETRHFIDHRLRVAGYDFTRPLFTKQAQAMIASYSEGIPRNINNVCFNAMSLGCVAKQKTIDADVIREVIHDLDVRFIFAAPETASKSKKPKAPMPVCVSSEGSRPPLRSWAKRFASAVVLMAATALSGLLVPTAGNELNTFASATGRTVRDSAVTPASFTVAPTQAHLTVSPSVAGAPQTSESNFIAVLPGQNLYRISLKIFGKYDQETLTTLRELNPWLTSARFIKPGQMIQISDAASRSRKILPMVEHVPATIGAGMEKP
jgi:general secretion pathway protein A